MSVKIENNKLFGNLVNDLTTKKIKVGVLKSTNKEYKNIDLAGIGLVQEKGSITNEIPATPWLSKPIETELNENHINGEDPLNSIGKKSVEIIKNSFNTLGGGTWTSNAPITIEGGWMKNKTSGKPFYVEGKGFDKRLTNKGKLKEGITYEIIDN